MKNIMKSKTILSALTGIVFVSVLTVGAFSIAPAVHAQEWDGGDYSGGCCGDVSYPDSIDYGNQTSYPDSIDYPQQEYTPEVSGYESYGSTGYSTGGYSTGGYNYTTPYYAPYHAPTASYATPSYSNTYAPTTITTTDNTCTINSCNNDDHSVVNISNPAPIINNVVANYGGSQANVQYCAQGYSGTYPNCYRQNQPIVYQAPIAYTASTPYVSLSQVPYTGLDLGFWGTIAYWGAMIAFALVVAYLIAIKRVQNVIALKLKNFLFGTTEEAEEVVVTTHAPAVQVAYSAPVATQSSEDVIDSFIMSQVNRPRRA